MELHRHAAATTSTGGFRRPHHRNLFVSSRLLGIAPHSYPQPNTTASLENELTEDDIFSSSLESSSSTLPTPTRSAANSRSQSHSHSHSHNHQGSLAALPSESESETRSVSNHKVSSASVSPNSPSSSASSLSATATPSSNSSRIIVPRRPPPPRRLTPQSAPVNVPVLSEAMRRSRAFLGFDDPVDVDDDEDEDVNIGEIVPPHEMVAAKNTPIVACSVVDGIGRTLKGRDLRKVRNAVWQRTGFMG